MFGGTDFVLGDSDSTQSSRGNTGQSRAMVKGNGGQLVINYGNDFYGGVLFGSDIMVDRIKGHSNADLISLGLGNAKINLTGGIARWQYNDSHYISQNSSGQITFYMNGSGRHVFNPDGTKSGGSIEIGGENLGMSPIDSPQILIEYIEFGIDLKAEGTRIDLDARYVQAITDFAVFANNGAVTEKGIDYFIIAGNGKADCRIVGKRVDYADTFWMQIAS